MRKEVWLSAKLMEVLQLDDEGTVTRMGIGIEEVNKRRMKVSGTPAAFGRLYRAAKAGRNYEGRGFRACAEAAMRKLEPLMGMIDE